MELAGIVHQPHEAWKLQIARNLTDALDGFLLKHRYLIVDRDPLFSHASVRCSQPAVSRACICLHGVQT